MLRRNILLGLLAVALTAAGPATRAEPDLASDRPVEPVDVYLLSGQSNMAGSGQVAQLSDTWQQPIEGALIFDGKGFTTLAATRGKRFGPEIGFAHYLRNNQPGRPTVYLIKFALSGQPLDAGWDGGAWQGPEPGPGRKTFYPGTSKDDPNTGLHYQRLMRQVRSAMQALVDDGKTPVLRGILWMQGEADAKNQVSADRYDKSLALLKKRIEEDVKSLPVPFVFGQVLPHEPALDRFTDRPLIRQRMAEADWRSESDRAVAGVWMVPTEGMELLKDTVHYSTKGQLALGQAFGLEILKAHRKASADQQAAEQSR